MGSCEEGSSTNLWQDAEVSAGVPSPGPPSLPCTCWSHEDINLAKRAGTPNVCKGPEVAGAKDDWRELMKVMEAAGQREGKEAKREVVKAYVWKDHGIHVNKIILTSV